MLSKVLAAALVGVVAFGSGIAFAAGDDKGKQPVSEANHPVAIQLPGAHADEAARSTAARGCDLNCKVRKLTVQVKKLTKFNKCLTAYGVAAYGEAPDGGDYGYLYEDTTVPSEFLTTALDWSGDEGEWLMAWKRSCR